MREANRLFLGDAHQGIQYVQKALWDAGLITNIDTRKRRIEYVDEETNTPGTIFMASYRTSEWKNILRGRRFLEICVPAQFKLDNEDFNLLLSRLEQVDDHLYYSSFSRKIMETERKRFYDPYPILPYDSISNKAFFPISCWRKGIGAYFEDLMSPTEDEFRMVEMVYGGEFPREQTERWKARR